MSIKRNVYKQVFNKKLKMKKKTIEHCGEKSVPFLTICPTISIEIHLKLH